MPGGWLGLPGWGEPIEAFIGAQEIALIFLVALVVFGPKSIPELARLLAKIMQQFREASAELQRNLYMDDVRDLQRELRDTWRGKPERMRKVPPQPPSESKPPDIDPGKEPSTSESPEETSAGTDESTTQADTEGPPEEDGSARPSQ